MKNLTVSAAVVAATLAAPASADIVAGFTFNNVPNTSAPVQLPYAAEYGTGTLTSNFGAPEEIFLFSGSTVGAVNGDPSGRGAAFRVGENARNNGAYGQFAFDASGFGDLFLTFATKTTSGTGFTSLDIQVSGDGVNFTTVESLVDLRDDVNWLLKTVDLSGASVLEDNSDAAIRVVFFGGDASNPTANTRIENFIISGTAVPTPASATLLGLGVVVAGRRRRG